MDKIIEIDGSSGEGGGQILRTSLTLSCITGRPVRVYNIRAGRKSPGLKPQHLICVQAAGAITGGRLKGAELDSMEVTLHPGRIRPGEYTFDVASIKASAGSTGLIFQTIILPLGFAVRGSRVRIRGGTHVEWSPPADYLKAVFLPTIAPMGVRCNMNINSWGFYPIGGGEIEVAVKPFSTPLCCMDISERGRLKRMIVDSIVANLPLSIAERQYSEAVECLGGLLHKLGGGFREVSTPSKAGRGTFIFILAEFENVRAGFSALGALGKRAEKVADEAVGLFFEYFSKRGALEPHLADQVVLPMALADEESSFTTTEITRHLMTNISVIERFLPVKFVVEGCVGGWGRVSVEGLGLRPELM